MSMDMYNQDTKIRFMNIREEDDLSIKLADQTFRKMKPYEEKVDKDCSNFNYFEILNVFKTLNTRSLNSLTNINSILKIYTDWALSEGLVPDAQNHYSEVTVETMKDCINLTSVRKRLVNRREVLEYARNNNIQNDDERFLLLAFFEGIGGGDTKEEKGLRYIELANLTLDDIDDETRVAHLCTGRDVKMSDELYHYAIRSGNQYEYYTEQKTLQLAGREIVKSRASVTTVSSKMKCRRIYRRILSAFEHCGISDWMTPNALLDSGYIQWLNEMKDRFDVNARAFISNGPYNEEFTEMFRKQFGTVKNYSWYKQHEEYLK